MEKILEQQRMALAAARRRQMEAFTYLQFQSRDIDINSNNFYLGKQKWPTLHYLQRNYMKQVLATTIQDDHRPLFGLHLDREALEELKITNNISEVRWMNQNN